MQDEKLVDMATYKMDWSPMEVPLPLRPDNDENSAPQGKKRKVTAAMKTRHWCLTCKQVRPCSTWWSIVCFFCVCACVCAYVSTKLPCCTRAITLIDFSFSEEWQRNHQESQRGKDKDVRLLHALRVPSTQARGRGRRHIRGCYGGASRTSGWSPFESARTFGLITFP
jgi:hypothetical protein